MSDWLYYLFAILLCVANLVAWLGVWYRLPGQWVMVANCTLYMAFFPSKLNGLGYGWFTIGLLILLATLGDSISYAMKRHHLTTNQNPQRPLKGIITGAGLGSLGGALLGFTVPIIGYLIALLGAIGGAAGGAYLGAMITESGYLKTEPAQPQKLPFGMQIDSFKIIPRLIAAGLIWLIATYGSFLG